MAVGSFFMLGGLSKNVSHHGWPTMENKKKHWLKHPKAVKKHWLKCHEAVPQIAKFGPK